MSKAKSAAKGGFWERSAPAVIFLLSCGIRVAQIVASRPHPREWTELEQVARSLYLNGAFADPYLHPTGPTAHVSPAIPLVIAYLYYLVGITWVSEFLQRALQAMVCSLQYALLPRVAGALGISRWFGVIAGLLAALAPYKGYIETEAGAWEQPYAALALLVLFLHTVEFWGKEKHSAAAVVERALGWGIAMLISPVLGVILAAVLLYEFFALRRRERLLLLLAVFAAVQVPWAVRNWIQLHGFVPGRSNFDLEFHMSNRPEAYALSDDNVTHGVLARFHPSHSEAEWQRVHDVGEVAYNREHLRAALAEIGHDPRRFACMTAERIWRFWLMPSRRFKTMLALAAVTLLGSFGILRMPRTPGVRLSLVILAAYPLIYYLIEVDRRYRYPIDWIFIVPAIWALAAIPAALARRPAGLPIP